MQPSIALTPEESEAARSAFERLDSFVAGAVALAEHLKRVTVNEIIAARATVRPPKE